MKNEWNDIFKNLFTRNMTHKTGEMNFNQLTKWYVCNTVNSRWIQKNYKHRKNAYLCSKLLGKLQNSFDLTNFKTPLPRADLDIKTTVFYDIEYPNKVV